MKKILILILIFLSAPILSARELKREWREYYRLVRRDRPREQIAKLHEIRELALERRFPDDLLHACREEERVYLQKDWKSGDSLRTALMEVVESYGEPLLTYRWLDRDFEYAKAHREELSAGYHPDLQSRKIACLQTRKTDDITDDFEWILWDRLISYSHLPVDSEEFRFLSEKIGDRYPARPYLYYLIASRAEDRLSAMQELAQQYAGDPFRFLPEKVVLAERLDRLIKDKNASESEAKALYNDAEAFTKAVKGEKGVYEWMDMSVDNILTTLRKTSLWIAFGNDSIILTGRNFGRGALTFRSDETRRTFTLRNRDGKFYVLDTVTAPVPILPDGSYSVSAEKVAMTSYEKHTLSLAVRQQGEDYAVYVTDYQTGEPVPSAEFRLKRGKKVLEKEIPLNGFTSLPADFQKMIGRKVALLEARIGERRSPVITVYKQDKDVDFPPASIHGRVFMDRGAYRPGDTLRGKAVLFKGDLNKRVSTVGNGEDVRIHIFNTEGKTMADIDLKTNEYGAVSWEWPIPVGERNGLFGLYVYYLKSNVTHSEFRVDNFVLPTFDLTFDTQEVPYFPGWDFEICGKVASYSGHPVDRIDIEGIITHNGKDVWKDVVPIGADGSFRIPLNLQSKGDYRLNLKAVDATGETRSFEHRFKVYSGLSLKVELDNAASGDFSFWSAKLEKTVLTEPVACFTWTVKNGDQPFRFPVTYQLVDLNGTVLSEGEAEETLELDLSCYPDGLYYIRGIVNDKGYQARATIPVLKLISGLDAPVRSVFLPGETEIESGESISARLGAGRGPVWAVATLAAPDGSVLESELLHLDGDRSMSELSFIYKDTYPDAVRLELFYFRDAEQVTHEAVYHRVRHSMDLPLSFSRFVDQTMPGTSCTITLQTQQGVEAAVAVFDKSLDAINPNKWEAVKLLSPAFKEAWSRSETGRITGEQRSGIFAKGDLVYGRVIDMAGDPVVGASIIAEGSLLGVTTDIDGCFSLDIKSGTILSVSSIGYKSVTVAGYGGIEVVLEEDEQLLNDVVVVAYGARTRVSLTGSVAGIVSSRIRGISSRQKSEQVIYGYRNPTSAVENAKMPDIPDDVYRQLFSEALAFEPFLYPDETGKVDITFRTSDKISSYHINVFAHNATMRNAVLQRDLLVTIPVRISVTPPRYLYEKDEYELSSLVSNISEMPVSGRLYLQVNDGDDLQSVKVADLTVPAGGSASASYSVSAPVASGQPLVLRLVFEGDGFSDAVRLSIPVYQAAQSLTESHSALARTEAVDSLRRMFVNFPGEQAEVTVRTLREAAEEGLLQWTVPQDPDALSLSADFYARSLLGRDTTGTLAPILALRRKDGGFAWTEGMDSSPIVTATLLERFAKLRDKGIQIPDIESAVHYLDRSQFGNLFPMWCGGLSDEQYMDIRAMWVSVPFDLTEVEDNSVRRSRLRDFRRFARAYLTPGRYDYSNGWILDKARRVRTLLNLTASEEGLALGKAWGEQVFTASRFQKSIANDSESLRQYAVRHPSGALYYPNAILPFRGLLSSEVYAHTLLSGLLDGPVSDGVKLWLLLQNETQSWTGDPAYVDALQAVLDAPDSLLDKQIVTLTASESVPFEDIQASGNGMRVERKYYLEKDGNRTEVHTGDTLNIGDRLVASYELWSEENRSFVRIDAFREASLLPVDQRSGLFSEYGGKHGTFRAYRIDGLWTRLPQCYRDVRTDRTVWWLDVCPEETTVWEESLFVTQSGSFTAPVITVGSIYAPNYYANDAFRGKLNAK